MSATPSLSLGRVLVIAGSDSGAGAGVQADLKTVMALGGYATCAITAITAQDTLGVKDVWPVPPEAVKAQAEAALADIGADAVKTGMLVSAEIVEIVAALLDGPARGLPAVIDPVLVSTSGRALLDPAALDRFRALLVPRARLITPNAPEAAALTGVTVEDLDGQRRAAERLLSEGAGAVLVKGGHIEADQVVDLLATPDGETLFEAERIDTRHTHGTGCTLASACAAGLAQGLPLTDAIARAWAYTSEAIRQAPGLGRGGGPLGHGWALKA